jgi:tRNA (guanine37-N1)-methyltransferase|tara:strand:- start:1171 stop:1905 length:735 start_codon:yes stop_codon:yes gene_type:complete
VKIGVISLFPEMVSLIAQYGVVGRAKDRDLLSIMTYNPRDYTTDKYQKVDDKPYGGGPGMIMKYHPLKAAIDSAKKDFDNKCPILLMSPQGERFNQKIAREFASLPEIIIVSGRYEGIDQRIIDSEVSREISLGDYVVSGGEIPAMMIVDAVTRLLPDVLGDDDSSTDESFENDLLEYPQYTRPEMVDGYSVPKVLLSGDHKAIKKWRTQQSLTRTSEKRPDMLNKSNKDQEKIINKNKQRYKD